jgi:hypothetical protein
MNILKIIHGYPPQYNAGSEVYSQSICNELAKKHSITVFTREANVYKADHTIQKQTKDNINFYYVNKAREKDGYQETIFLVLQAILFRHEFHEFSRSNLLKIRANS